MNDSLTGHRGVIARVCSLGPASSGSAYSRNSNVFVRQILGATVRWATEWAVRHIKRKQDGLECRPGQASNRTASCFSSSGDGLQIGRSASRTCRIRRIVLVVELVVATVVITAAIAVAIAGIAVVIIAAIAVVVARIIGG